MKAIHDTEIDWEKTDPAHFTGEGRIKRVFAMHEYPLVKIYRVEFRPEARTNWHTHSGVQLLHIAEGCCRVQTWGADLKEVGPGDMVFVPPGEKHWHGASPGSTMVHFAFNINASTTWMERVSEEQYSMLSV
jgi:quercetin dioxygenase-like cupin family protein